MKLPEVDVISAEFYGASKRKTDLLQGKRTNFTLGGHGTSDFSYL
jgi:hypothetical protein